MGKEASCVVRFGGKKSAGKALLETNELVFRGDFRLKIAFASLKSAEAINGELRLETPDGLAVFELGEQAAKWCDKILHPKSRLEKLGIKADAQVALLGDFDREFLNELRTQTKHTKSGKLDVKTEWIFLAAEAKKELSPLAKLAKGMSPTAAIWVIYPKRQKELTENDVLSDGRKAGRKDVKVMGFSVTHPGVKFVVPP